LRVAALFFAERVAPRLDGLLKPCAPRSADLAAAFRDTLVSGTPRPEPPLVAAAGLLVDRAHARARLPSCRRRDARILLDVFGLAFCLSV